MIGPLSDAVGRRRPLLAGHGRCTCWPRSCACSSRRTSWSSAPCGCCRASAGPPPRVVAMAVVRDLFEGPAAATMISRLILVLGAAPILAPTLGGAAAPVHVLARDLRGARGLRRDPGRPRRASACRRRCRPERRRSTGVGRHWADYRLAAARPGLRGSGRWSPGSTMAALFTYVAGSSFVYQEQFGLDEQQFGLLFGAGAVGLIGATQANPLLLRRCTAGPGSSYRPGRRSVRSPGAVLCSRGDRDRWAARRRPGPSGWSSPRPAWRCPTHRRWRCPGTGRPPARPRRCSGPSSSASVPPAPVVGLLGNDALAMGTVVLAGRWCWPAPCWRSSYGPGSSRTRRTTPRRSQPLSVGPGAGQRLRPQTGQAPAPCAASTFSAIAICCSWWPGRPAARSAAAVGGQVDA